MLKIYPDPETIRAQWPALLQFCQELHQQFDQSGTVLFDSRNTIRRYELEGTPLIVKRYKRPNLLSSIGYGVQRNSKAHKALRNGLELIRRGFRTPCPYAAVEVWSQGGLRLGECYSLCGECTAPLDLAKTLNDPETPDPEVARRFAFYAAELHKKGVMMVDLNSTNVLFDPKDFQETDPAKWFQLIDINRMSFLHDEKQDEFSLSQRLENLTRFTGKLEVFRLVARHYAEAYGLPIEEFERQAVARKLKHDKMWRMRKRITHPIKNRHYGDPPQPSLHREGENKE